MNAAADPSMAAAGMMGGPKMSADHTTDLILQLPMAAGFAVLVSAQQLGLPIL